MTPSPFSLDELFEHLRITEDPDDISLLQDQIWAIWLDSGEASLDYLIGQGSKAITRKDLSSAIELFTQAIELAPHWPEAWNKRATAYYLRGNLKAAKDDIEETLRLEPRHFGALSGLAAIYTTIGDLQNALTTAERLRQLVPGDEGVQQQVKELREQLGL